MKSQPLSLQKLTHQPSNSYTLWKGPLKSKEPWKTRKNILLSLPAVLHSCHKHTVCYCPKDKHVKQWIGTENPEINSQIWNQLAFQKKSGPFNTLFNKQWDNSVSTCKRMKPDSHLHHKQNWRDQWSKYHKNLRGKSSWPWNWQRVFRHANERNQ